MKLLARFLLLVLAILVTARLVPGIEVEGFWAALFAALILALVNFTIRPLLFILTLPLTIITFGLFAFVINALTFWLVGAIVEGFMVNGFVAALLGSLVVSAISWLGSRFL